MMSPRLQDIDMAWRSLSAIPAGPLPPAPSPEGKGEQNHAILLYASNSTQTKPQRHKGKGANQKTVRQPMGAYDARPRNGAFNPAGRAAIVTTGTALILSTGEKA